MNLMTVSDFLNPPVQTPSSAAAASDSPSAAGPEPLNRKEIEHAAYKALNSLINPPDIYSGAEYDPEGRRELDEFYSKNYLSLNIVDENGIRKQQLIKRLGCGGSKRAILLDPSTALLIPNMDIDPISKIAERWERNISEEIAVSEFIKTIGFLSPSLKKVHISISDFMIPAYTSESFESFNSKGIFIIDQKNKHSSSWKYREKFLFKTNAERLEPENWNSPMSRVIVDIMQLILYKANFGSDSKNLALVEKRSERAVCQHEIRYFCFDFSSKMRTTEIPELTCNPQFDSTKIGWIENYAFNCINEILISIFDYEFSNSRIPRDQIKEFREKLEKKYTQVFMEAYHKTETQLENPPHRR